MLETSYPSQVFRGVHFVLFGFNPITESKVRFKLVNGGGVDAGKYNGNCTHVIVDKIAHDDPVCVAARKDGKTLVTALWVEHSADIGMPVDPASVMYRPLKDLNGIPGANNLIICLTGYLRQDRDDIMTMVGLMGAQFSKPLVANKVTHLICYKFEGEKYVLAKRMGTIKLVNHRWLEDCLKDWVLLPEDKYNKSGYELETMGEEAKDSEEEPEDSKLGQSGGRNINKSPLSSKFGIVMTNGLSKSVVEASNASPDSAAPQVLPKVNKGRDSLIIPGNKNKSDQDFSFDYVDDQISSEAPDVSRHATSCQLPDKYVKTSESKNADFPKALDCQDLGITGNTISSGPLPDLHAGTSESKKLVSDLRSTTASAERLTHSDAKFSAPSYSRNNQRRFSLPRNLDECSGNATGPAVSPLDDWKVGNNLETSSNKVEKASEGIKSTCVEGSGNGNDFIKGDEPFNLLPQKRINEASSNKLKSRKIATDAKLSKERIPLANRKSQVLKMTSLVDEPPEAEGYFSVGKDGMNNSNTRSISKSAASNPNLEAFDEPFSKNASSESADAKLIATDAKLSKERIPLANRKSQVLKMTSLVDEPPEAEDYFSVGKDGMINSNTRSISKSAASNPNPEAFDEPFSKNASSESAQCDNAFQYSAQAGVQSLSESKIYGKPDITDFEMGQVDGNVAEQHNILKNLECSSPGNKKSQNEESVGLINLDLSNDESAKLIRKSPHKKSVAKRSLGCRPKAVASAKHKKTVSSNKTTPRGEGVNSFSGRKEISTCDAEKLQASPRILDVNKSKQQETVGKYAEDAGGRTEFLDDETEAPDDKFEDEFGMALDENKSESVLVSKTADVTTEKQSGAVHCMTKSEEAMPPKKGTNRTEKHKPPTLADTTSKLKAKHQAIKRPAGRTKKITVAKDLLKSEEAVSVEKIHNDLKVKVMHQAIKRPAGRTKKTSVAKDLSESEEAVSVEKIHNERKHEAEMEILEEMPPPVDISKSSTAPRNKSQNFIEEDKENRPIDEEHDAVEGKSVGNQIIKSIRRPANINSKKIGLNPSMSEANTRVKTEAVCFIVSGHRLQRKEFQQVIKRLKGRVCRDSHQWSYQATHFIAPDPVKRTEKFFAAAASGRWILKTDFLTASSQAGKFLPEEPFEWHKSGLSEDGAINMEAPRKWRLLRERTGHGVFHGMRIIVYGDCIAPPLDTLKRVVKAGDGTILATSPPYTRFLGTGIDYAIVSPGMPRVDLWVQEFLKHEIPCVAADYLVEYVCKPGFSLERHVLYGTHSWAERSYDKLQSRAEEIIEVLIPPKDCDDNDDTICQVCGSRDRGDVMLICGDESGSLGCGVGTHIDCCDPPLTEVPEEDWFCPKCSGTQNCSNSPTKRKKCALSSSKRK